MSGIRSEKGIAQVRRITVDERLAEDLIRVVACPLVKEYREFLDYAEIWGKELQYLIRPHNYVKKLGILSPEDWPWEALEEGQVFLSGEFEIVLSDGKAEYFRIHRDQNQFQRIDDQDVIKKDTKKLYTEALAGRQRDKGREEEE